MGARCARFPGLASALALAFSVASAPGAGAVRIHIAQGEPGSPAGVPAAIYTAVAASADVDEDMEEEDENSNGRTTRGSVRFDDEANSMAYIPTKYEALLLDVLAGLTIECEGRKVAFSDTFDKAYVDGDEFVPHFSTDEEDRSVGFDLSEPDDHSEVWYRLSICLCSLAKPSAMVYMRAWRETGHRWSKKVACMPKVVLSELTEADTWRRYGFAHRLFAHLLHAASPLRCGLRLVRLSFEQGSDWASVDGEELLPVFSCDQDAITFTLTQENGVPRFTIQAGFKGHPLLGGEPDMERLSLTEIFPPHTASCQALNDVHREALPRDAEEASADELSTTAPSGRVADLAREAQAAHEEVLLDDVSADALPSEVQEETFPDTDEEEDEELFDQVDGRVFHCSNKRAKLDAVVAFHDGVATTVVGNASQDTLPVYFVQGDDSPTRGFELGSCEEGMECRLYSRLRENEESKWRLAMGDRRDGDEVRLYCTIDPDRPSQD